MLTPNPLQINLAIVWETFIFVPGLNNVKKTNKQMHSLQMNRKKSFFSVQLLLHKNYKIPIAVFFKKGQKPLPNLRKKSGFCRERRESKTLKWMFGVMNKAGAPRCSCQSWNGSWIQKQGNECLQQGQGFPEDTDSLWMWILFGCGFSLDVDSLWTWISLDMDFLRTWIPFGYGFPLDMDSLWIWILFGHGFPLNMDSLWI